MSNRQNLQTEREKGRALWEEVFQEDSAQFLDYYDECMADHNQIYLDEEGDGAAAMLHRNPYEICIGEDTARASYIVAVATKEKYRHQGRMRRLLVRALEDCCREEEPFAYLMPASEAIYLPFDFRTVYYQKILTLGSVYTVPKGQETEKRLVCEKAEKEELAKLAALSGEILGQHCAVYTKRSMAYYERIWKEQEAVNGGILLFYSISETQGGDLEKTLEGYCFTGHEDEPEAWELVLRSERPQEYAQAVHAITEYFEKDLPVKISGFLPGTQIAGCSPREFAWRPMMMVRITNLYALARRLRAKQATEAILHIEDSLLPENNGKFRLIVDEAGGRLEAVLGKTGAENCIKMTIAQLTEALFGLREIKGFPSGKLKLLHPLYFNELV